MQTARDFCYRLFFTRDDDLDVLQLLFLVLAALFLFVFMRHAQATGWQPSNGMLTTFGAVFATLAIAGTPRWVAELLSKHPPSSIAAAIATAKVEPRLPSKLDDERGSPQ